MIRLAAIIRDHGEALESDLLRFYGADIAHVGTDRLTWRRFAVLMAHLPRESSYVQAVAGERARWGDTEHLLALIADALHVGNYQRARAHFKGNPKAPDPLPRPGKPTPGKRRFGNARMTVDQLRKTLNMDRG
jgi:hypothetical protein